MSSQEIRRKFLQYFKTNRHAVISSSPVVPHEDPTLLFINAGMNQFKDVFLGRSRRDYNRAATSQKCIRAGGKHNDLDNVGHTSRHLTFFEMLGNFSFGDYFKEDAIRFAWEVSLNVFGFDPKRIWATVFRDDDEAFKLWTDYLPASKIVRMGEDTNFWAMGDTGPCGPCSELLYDRGEAYGSAASPEQDSAGERYLEFWNLVFMQFNRNAEGILEPLPRPSIDTGAGLERVMSLRLQVESVFETDILQSLIQQVEQLSQVSYSKEDHLRAPAFHVVADHLRGLAFAIADGAQPSNVDRGYVLRKMLRRAVRYGRTLGFEEPFLAKVLPRLVETMGEDYPELKQAQKRIAEILTLEEEAFIRTLRRGGNLLGQVMERAKEHGKQISGTDAFKLKDTYGLPLDEIITLAKDADLSVDLEQYRKLEEEAKMRSRNVQKVTAQQASKNLFEEYLKEKGPCCFLGYDQDEADGIVTAIVKRDQLVDRLQEGEEGSIVLNQTPFYAEMGGQVGDAGCLMNAHAEFLVEDCQAPYKGVIAHKGRVVSGAIQIGDSLLCKLDRERRRKIAKNHTATHLLHWALQKVLGEHIKQAGSVVEATRLRFDFNHHKALTVEEIRKIEELVNARIRENHAVHSYEIPYEEAQKRADIKQFFGEKYDSKVRVIDIEFSKELCGGTHISSLGVIGLVRIIKEGSIAAGVRRIEAVTGEEAESFVRQSEDLVAALATMLKVQSAQLPERIEKLLADHRNLSQELKTHRQRQLLEMVAELLQKKEEINGKAAVIAELPLSSEELATCAAELSSRMPHGIIVLGTALPEKCHVVIRVSDDLVSKGVNAQNLVKNLCPLIEGSGGGKAGYAQAGGKAPHKLAEALTYIRDLI